jgi:tetratricopeptide (TPR) repeat protein
MTLSFKQFLESLAVGCVVLTFGVNPSIVAAEAAIQPESRMVAQARELVDTYYGNQSNLKKSAELLELAYKANPNDANVFVEAARITGLGGYVGFDNYEAGTFARVGALLDKAISLDDVNPKAHILKAHIFDREQSYDRQVAELNKAKAVGTKDPWLWVGYGIYYENIGDTNSAHEMYSNVEKNGPGLTASTRKAYIVALNELSRYGLPETRKERLTKYAALSLKARYPIDAWTPHGYAENFIDIQDFDDAIIYAREALKTMNFGAGRLTLGSALYAKAAQQLMAGGKPDGVRPLIDEANKLGFDKSTVIEYLVQRRGLPTGSLKDLVPTLDTIIQ